ncbi:MAG TPA: transglutaminase family protein, partial [Vicinamibacterales bacterium]|nr:transglutaminase family protein [Vicinamibacterales bacterium]
MSIHVALRHVTHYRYDRGVVLSPQLVRLRPAPHCRTRVLSYSQTITPQKHFVNWQQDPQSNYVARVTFPDPVREFRVEIDLVAEMSVYNPFDFFLEPEAERFPFGYDSWQLRELQPFLSVEEPSPRLREYLAGINVEPRRTIDFLVDLNRQLQRHVRYVIRMEPGVQTPDETLATTRGSCRDTTWLLVQLLRQLGLAARFVSGYLIQLTPDEKSLDGPSGSERDFTDLHAWCEVYLPGAGWIGLDPTSGLLAGEGHLPLACTPEPASAAPVSGDVQPCEVEFSHTMWVT